MAEIAQGREYADGDLVPGTPYRVVRLIGAGGMGCVYEVEHVELLRRFVLKSLLKSLAGRDDLIARMRNEWRALGRLSHENIVDVSNAGMVDGAPYYVMELLIGETLSQRMRRLKKMPCAEAVRIAVEILHGLAAAHEIGVVHRDIKPANVFVTEQEVVKILDFGIAKCRDDSALDVTAQGLAIGTPRYMSPEQVSGEGATPQSDLYAVGLLLFEMIAGRGPFDDLRGQTEVMMAHLSRTPPSLSALAELPEGLEAVVAKALAKSPDDRPRCAREMAEALARWAGPRLPGAWKHVSGAVMLGREGASSSAPALRSDEPTVAQDVPLPEAALSSAPTTAPDRDHATKSQRSSTEPIVLDDALRDATTRTSHRLRNETPSHVHSLTPVPPASAGEHRILRRLVAAAALVAFGVVALVTGARVIDAGEPMPSSSSPASSAMDDSPSPGEVEEAFAFDETEESEVAEDEGDAGVVADQDAQADHDAQVEELVAFGEESTTADEVGDLPADSPETPAKPARRRSLPSSGL